MRDDTSTIDHADLRRELKEVCEAIAALQRRVNLIELSQRPYADRTADMICGVNARALDDRLRHIEDVIDLLNRHIVQLIASYGDRIKKLEQGTRATSSLWGVFRMRPIPAPQARSWPNQATAHSPRWVGRAVPSIRATALLRPEFKRDNVLDD